MEKECYSCGRGPICYGNHRFPQWYHNYDSENNVLCPICNKKYFAGPRQKGRTVTIDGKRRVYKGVMKAGFCSKCQKNIHDKSCKITTMIAINDKLVEMCNACLNRHYRNIGLLKNKLVGLEKKCELCLRRTTKSYATQRTPSYERWFTFNGGVICYTCKARLKGTKIRRGKGIKIRIFRMGVRLEEQIRKLDNYIKWRKNVVTRDKQTCRECGKKARPIHAHHIRPFRMIILEEEIDTLEKAINCTELWDINNGLSLCYTCHKRVTA